MSWMIGMPNLGHTMEEGKVSQWLKKPGDAVRAGEVIAVVESDKASFDVESPADGILARIDAAQDSVLAVGSAIGWIVAPGEELQDGKAALPGVAAPQDGATAHHAAPEPASSAAPAQGRGRISPAARALAESAGIDWTRLAGSGDDGMVTRDDVREAIASARTSAEAAPAADATPRPADAGAALQQPSPMRRAIAQATHRSWAAIPHVPLNTHAEVDALLARRPGQLTASIVRACALALREHPALNGWWREAGFQPATGSQVGLSISTPGGLVNAVVRDAHALTISGIRSRIEKLAAQAREGQLAGADMLGASFTVSTLGRWGVDTFAPIIAAPEVAILGVGRVRREARETDSGGVRFASVVGLTLVFDHRANDGVESAKFLGRIVELLQKPEQL